MELPSKKITPQPVPVIKHYTVGRSVEDRPIDCHIIGEGEDVTFILASIHGDEKAGVNLAVRLVQHLEKHYYLLKGRKVVIIPVANPDGRALQIRYNARGVDLNRNFTALNRINCSRFGMVEFSEPETRIIDWIIQEHSPDRIVSIHGPLACVDYDGPGRELAYRMADRCGLPVLKLGAKPGSFGSYAGETLGIPIITFELPGEADDQPREYVWELYRDALIEAVTYTPLRRKNYVRSGKDVLFRQADIRSPPVDGIQAGE
ncbi:DUF2817 domain-containing protein [Desulfococcaceae bacterium HSG8]|nr:DUF2817 domain-containing protein [Desulfococcaceae bacterium HSG8]